MADLSFQNCLILLSTIRVVGAITSHIRDCDEAQLLEPTHYLLWLWHTDLGIFAHIYFTFVCIHIFSRAAWYVCAGNTWWHNKVFIFYAIRVILGLFARIVKPTFIELFLIGLGVLLGATLVITAFSSGMFFSSVA